MTLAVSFLENFIWVISGLSPGKCVLNLESIVHRSDWPVHCTQTVTHKQTSKKTFKMKFNQKSNLYLINVDVSASTEAFLETVCLIAVPRSVSGRIGCRRCGRVGKTPRLCSLTCLAPSWCVSPPWSICPLCCLPCRWLWPDPNLWRGRGRLQSKPKRQH